MVMELCEGWRSVLRDYVDSVQFSELCARVDKEYGECRVFPSREDVFAAFNLCPYDKVRVVILGQDPYFNEGEAVGLAFSVGRGCRKFPPTLRNIIKEVRAEFGGECAVEDGDLGAWARQGVLLLNTCLTVRAGEPFSHRDIGWDKFIDCVIREVDKKDDVVFVFWGRHAQGFERCLVNSRNLVLKSAHPSPLSAGRGFFGCGHFLKVNEFLRERGKGEIGF